MLSSLTTGDTGRFWSVLPLPPTSDDDHRPLDWLEEERSLPGIRRELQRLKRRARTRPVHLILMTAVLTTAALYYQQSRAAPHEAVVIMRVTENTAVGSAETLAGHQLGEYLSSVALSNSQLIAVIDTHNLYPLRRARGAIFAIETLRDNMELELYDNFFAAEHTLSDTARTARITLSFRDKDPDVALSVAQDLAQSLIANEQQRRELTGKKAALVANRALERIRNRAFDLSKRLARIQVVLSGQAKLPEGQTRADVEAEEKHLAMQYKRATRLLKEAERQKQQTDLYLAANAAEIGTHFSIVDMRPPAPHPPTAGIALAMWAVGLFLILLPLCAITMAAFDSRLHSSVDVMRLGMPAMGEIPAFRGHQVGTLADRGGPGYRVKSKRKP